MYYGLIVLSVVMFGGCFSLNDLHRKLCGSSFFVSLRFSLVGSLSGLAVLFSLNGLKLEFTWFTFLMALWMAINGFLFTFCGFKALGTINLSLYSLFSMLGGMLLPFLQGIFFYHESFTVAKAVCLIFIVAALFFTVEKQGKKNGTVYYVGIFILNGMSGVISKLFTSSSCEKTGVAGYSVLAALCTVVISSVLLLILSGKKKDSQSFTAQSTAVAALGGALNRVANFILVVALAHVQVSAQYPLVTGGVIIVSTLICFFGQNKPKKKELVSVALAFFGMLALFIIPL